MAKVVFMGTPKFSVLSLQKLVETQSVQGVVTQPDRPSGRGQKSSPSPVKVVAEQAGIPVYQPKSLRSEEAAVPLRQWDPDIIIVAAFGQILRPHVLNLPPLGCVNIHASLLPRWRGASPLQHAILAGDKETGVTLMQMDEGMDTGPILIKRSILIHGDETAATLHDRLAELGAVMLEEHLDDILNGRLLPQPQDSSLATYAPLIKKEDGRLNWHQSSREIDRHIRAMTPWPGTFTTWKDQQLKVLEARPIDDQLPGVEPGTVLNWGEKIVICTKDSGIEIKRVQLTGRRAMAIHDFIPGQPEFVGSKLG